MRNLRTVNFISILLLGSISFAQMSTHDLNEANLLNTTDKLLYSEHHNIDSKIDNLVKQKKVFCVMPPEDFYFDLAFGVSDMSYKVGGVNFNSDYKVRPVVYVGASAEFDIDGLGGFFENKDPALIVGLEYTPKGSRGSYSYMGYEQTYKNKLNYLSLQPNFKINVLEKPLENSSIDVYAETGLRFSLAISGTDVVVTKNNGSETKNKYDIDFGNSSNDDFRRSDLSFNIGAGVELDQFKVGLEYGQSLIRNRPKDLTSDVKSKFNEFRLNASYKISFN